MANGATHCNTPQHPTLQHPPTQGSGVTAKKARLLDAPASDAIPVHAVSRDTIVAHLELPPAIHADTSASAAPAPEFTRHTPGNHSNKTIKSTLQSLSSAVS